MEASQAVITKSIVQPPPDIDFATLQAKNPDTKAWLTVPGTSSDQVVVQRDETPTSGSDYYLHNDFYGNYSQDGLFFDPTNAVGGEGGYSQNLIIYGHNMKDGDMFGELSKYEDEAF